MGQLLFELKMMLLGAWYAFVVSAHLATGALMTVAVTLIGLGFLLRLLFRRLGNLVIIVGIVAFFLLPRLSGLLGIFPYGMDDAGKVAALGSKLKFQGVLSPDDIQAYGGKPSIFMSAPAASSGHAYISLNKLGHSPLTPKQLTGKIASDLNAVFPIYAKGRDGNAVKAGNEFNLGIIRRNPVLSSAQYGHYFSLTTEPGHFLIGTANHGIARDSSGNLWLFQYGVGASKEKAWEQLWNYPLAERMWNEMAARTSAAFSQDLLGTR
jgi:hypothetical protein